MTTATTSTLFSQSRTLENSVWYLGPSLFTTLADGAATGGRYTMLHITTERGAEPPPHTHTHEDEVFYVLSGEMEVHIGDEALRVGPGAMVHLPQGVQHHWSILSETLDCICILTPAGLEGYFRHPELSRPAEALELGPPLTDPSRYMRAAQLLAEYGVAMPPPPGA